MRGDELTPKEYLSQAILLDEKIETNLEVLEGLKSRVFGTSAKLSDDVRVQTSGRTDVTDTIDKIIDLERIINQEIDELVDLKKKLTLEINGLENNTYSLLLMKRYILDKKLYEIAKEMCYSYGAIRNMHGLALEEFGKKYLKEK